MEKRLANRAGLGLNALAAELNRFGNGTLGSGWTSKMATGTLRASGLIAMTEARKRAFGVTYMSALGQIAKDAPNLAALDKHDHRILLSKGITDTDFAVWTSSEEHTSELQSLMRISYADFCLTKQQYTT